MISTRAIFYLVALGVTCVSGFTSREKVETTETPGLVCCFDGTEQSDCWMDATPSPTASPTKLPTQRPTTERPTGTPTEYPTKSPAKSKSLQTEGRGCDSDTDCLGDGNSKSICVKAIPSSRRSLLFTKVLEDKVKAKEGICRVITLSPTTAPTTLSPTTAPSESPTTAPSLSPTTAPSVSPTTAVDLASSQYGVMQLGLETNSLFVCPWELQEYKVQDDTCVPHIGGKEYCYEPDVLECPAEDTTVDLDTTPESSGSLTALIQGFLDLVVRSRLLRWCGGDAWQSAFNRMAAQGLAMPQFLTDLLFDQALELSPQHFNKLFLWSMEVPTDTLSAAFALTLKLPVATYIKLNAKIQTDLPAETLSRLGEVISLLPFDELETFTDHAAAVLPEADFSLQYETISSVLRNPDYDPDAKAVLAEVAKVAGFGG